jgi:hypothetical protein
MNGISSRECGSRLIPLSGMMWVVGFVRLLMILFLVLEIAALVKYLFFSQ